MTDGEQGARGRTRYEVGEDLEEKAELTTTSENQEDTGNGAAKQLGKVAAREEETCGNTPGRAAD